MKVVVAVVTCEKRCRWTAAQRATWVRDSEFDVRFFLAAQAREPLADEVFLDVGDDYVSLPEKVRAVSRWAIEHDYDSVLKLDDDVILFPNRTRVPVGDYVGWRQEWKGNWEWCAGMAYWLSRRALKIMAAAELDPQMSAEDRWTGETLSAAGIQPISIGSGGIQWVGKCMDGKRCKPLPKNCKQVLQPAYVAGEFLPEEMSVVYR